MYMDREFIRSLRDWQESLDNNRGTRAELRRAFDIDELLFLPSFYCESKRFLNWPECGTQRLACILGILSHVKEHNSSTSLAKYMAGKGNDGGRPRVNELRVKRLLQKSTRDEAYVDIVRIIKMLKGSVHIDELLYLLYYWGLEKKRKFAEDYFTFVYSGEEKNKHKNKNKNKNN